jgi:hypothetical protein
MHTDPFGWLLPKNDRLLWVRSPTSRKRTGDGAGMSWRLTTQLTQTKSGRTSELIAHF